MRNLRTESLRYPGQRSSTWGKSGTKLRRRSIGEEQSVNNPIPFIVVKDGVTQERDSARGWKSASKVVGWLKGKAVSGKPRAEREPK